MGESNALWIHFIILFTCTFYKGFDLSGTCYDNVWADVWLNGGSPGDDFSYLAAADMFTWKGWLTAYSAYVLNNLSGTVISAIALNFVYAMAYTYNSGWSLCGPFEATGVPAALLMAPRAITACHTSVRGRGTMRARPGARCKCRSLPTTAP